MQVDTDGLVRGVLDEVMPRRAGTRHLAANDVLADVFPELDSMAAVSIITLLEERGQFTIEPGELDAAVFATFGSLVDYVQAKRLDAA